MSYSVDSNDLPLAFGPYTLLKRIAVGGMAEVYVAKTRGMGGFEKRVALKLIHPRFSEDEQFIQMLVEEAKLSVLLTHRNIAQTFDLGCIDNTYFIVMEYIEGADCFRLSRKVKAAQRALPFDVCAHIAAEVCSGLDYAHRRRDSNGRPLNIVHRDISPQNVLLSFSGEVKLVDFGIAKFALKQEDTQTGVIKGKYNYMSPEQAWGDPTDHRSDIFSAGIVLYELLIGDMLYQSASIPQLLDAVRRAEIPPPNAHRSDIPWELTEVVMRAVAKRPGDRYQSAHDMADALRRFLDRQTPAFSPERLIAVLGSHFEAEAQASIVSRFPSRPPSIPPASDEDTIDFMLPLMQKEEFEPHPQQSVIFNLKNLSEPVRKSLPPSPSKRPSLAPRATFRPPALASKPRGPEAIRPPSPFETSPGGETQPRAQGEPDLDFDDPTFIDDGAAMRAILDASMPPQPAPVIRGSRSGKPSARASDLGSPSSQPGPTAPAAPALKVGRSPRPDGARVVPRPMDVRDSWRSKGTAPEASAGGAAPLPEAPKPFRPDPIQGPTGPTERVRVRRARLRMAVLYVGLLAVAVIALAFVYRMRLRDSVVIEVQSIPNGATVSLDGREFSQRTPAIIRGGLEPGKEYTLKVSLDGYRALERKFTATDGPNVQIATLEPAVTHVTIDTTPAGARVWVDEVSQGTAPVDLPDVKPGSTLLVRAQASGFRETTQQVRVDVGERDVRIEIALEPKP